MMIRFVTAAVLAAVLALGSPARTAAQSAASSPSSEAPAKPVRVDGFRGAKWGMNEAEVKAIIVNEFKIPLDKPKTEQNLNERTAVLSVSVPDLIEGAGTARVSYIFGYTTKKLIQVNVIWGTPADPQAKPEMVVAAANQLRDLFVNAGYDQDTIVANARAGDGTVVVFEGQ